MSDPTYRLRGIAPPDLAAQPAAVRVLFWGWVVDLGLKAKDQDLAKGLDAQGKPLRAISAKTAKYRRSAMTPSGKGDPKAPPLMPARALSRTRSLLAGRATPDAAVFYWRFDPFSGDSWGVVLAIHRRKGRDVIGLSPAATARVRAQAWAMWERWKADKVTGGQGDTVNGSVTRPPGHLVTASGQGPGIPRIGSYSTKYATYGINAAKPSTNFGGKATGGLTGPELRRYLTTPAAVSIPGRPGPGAPGYNRLLAHVWGGNPPRPGGAKKAEGPKAPRPKPAARPKPAPQPPPIDFRTYGTLSDADIAEMRAVVEALPRPVLEALHRARIGFAFAEDVASFDASLAADRPRGWPAGMTWEHADGMYHPLKKAALATKYLKSYPSGRRHESGRRAGVMRHEVGHAFDDALSRPSREDAFRAAYDEDVARIPAGLRPGLEYYLQGGHAGPGEVFAEGFAEIHGTGAAPAHSPREVLDNFPRCVDLIREWAREGRIT